MVPASSWSEKTYGNKSVAYRWSMKRQSQLNALTPVLTRPLASFEIYQLRLDELPSTSRPRLWRKPHIASFSVEPSVPWPVVSNMMTLMEICSSHLLIPTTWGIWKCCRRGCIYIPIGIGNIAPAPTQKRWIVTPLKIWLSILNITPPTSLPPTPLIRLSILDTTAPSPLIGLSQMQTSLALCWEWQWITVCQCVPLRPYICVSCVGWNRTIVNATRSQRLTWME